MSRPSSAPTVAAIAVALTLWASAFAGIRVGLTAFSPGELALLRFGTASIALAIYALATKMRLPAMRDLPVVAAAGLLGITIYHLALNRGETSVSAGAASVLIASSPVFTAVLARLFLSEKLSAWGWAGIGAAFSGTAIIALAEGEGLSFEPMALVVLLASVSTAAYFIVSKPPLRRYGALEFTAYSIWAGTVPLLVFAPSLARSLPEAGAAPTVTGVYMGIFPGAIAYVLWSYALARMPASRLSTFLYLQPVNAALIAWVWIGEVPTVLTVLGAAVTMAGVVMVNTVGRPAPEAAPEEERASDPLLAEETS